MGRLSWPAGATIVAILRNSRAIAPSADDVLESGDELFFIVAEEAEPDLLALLAPAE